MSGNGRIGAQPYQIENECSVGSSFHNRLSTGASCCAVALVQLQSTAYLWLVGFCTACATFSSAIVVCPRTWPSRCSFSGHASSGCRSSSDFFGRVAHHCRVQQQNGALGSRLSLIERDAGQPGRRDDRLDAAVQGRQNIVKPDEQRLCVVEPEGPGVLDHHLGQLVGLEVKARDERGKSGAGTTRSPVEVGCSGFRRHGPVRRSRSRRRRRRRSRKPNPSCGCSSLARLEAGSRRGRPTRSGRRETRGRARSGTARVRCRRAPQGSPLRCRWRRRTTSRAWRRGRSAGCRRGRSTLPMNGRPIARRP